ncbi:MAG: helix-turn-helix transcriptional regulator [Planctomycetota bacterium]
MKLSDYLITQQLGPAEFARRIGVGRMSVHRYISGERFPRPDVLARIARETAGQVTPNDFLTQVSDDLNLTTASSPETEKQEPFTQPVSGRSNNGDGDLVGRPLYPWSRLTANEQQVLDDAYDDMMDEPPEGSGLSPVVQEALETLIGRASHCNDQFKLDGRVTRITCLIEEANRVRRREGLPLLRYPGVPI